MSYQAVAGTDPENTVIAARLGQIERRLRWQLSFKLAAIGLAVGLGLSIVLALLSRTMPVMSQNQLVLASIVVVPFSTLSASFFAFVRRYRSLSLARLADRRAGLKERLSTAMEFAGKEGESVLIAAQRADAEHAATYLNPVSVVPFSAPRKALLVATGLLAVLLILIILPNPVQGVLEERAAAAQAIGEEKAKIEQVKKEVLEAAQSSPTEKQEELLHALDQLSKELSTSVDSREQALAKISAAEEKLSMLIDRNLPSERLGLDHLARSLQGLSKADSSLDLGASADPGQLGEDVNQLSNKLEEMGSSQRQESTDALAAVAESLSGSNPTLATQLARSADALRTGDLSAARNALSQAEGTLREMEQRLADQRSAERALTQLQNGRNAIAVSGLSQNGTLVQSTQGSQTGAQGQGSASGQSGSSGSGQGNNPGPGTGSSGNQGSGSGAPSGPGPVAGTNATTSPGASSSSTGQPATGRPGTTGVGGYEPVYSPGGVDSEGKPLFLPGVADDGESESQWIATQPGAGISTVPYGQVFEAYSAAAARSLDSSYIPVNLKDYIKGYFTSLEPKAGE